MHLVDDESFGNEPLFVKVCGALYDPMNLTSG